MKALEVKEILKREAPEIKTGKLEQGCMRYGVGKNTLWDRRKVDEYFNELTQNETNIRSV